MGEAATGRKLLQITGTDRLKFLQNLVTNEMARLDDRLVYAALLTPQGKYLADFLVTEQDGAVLIDVAQGLAPDLLRRLSMYKLRADVEIGESPLHIQRGLDDAPDSRPAGALPDPRHPALGWRAYTTQPGSAEATDWDAIRVAHLIPETCIELIPNETYILEAGFERLNGVDFRKGCYVGQEVTARMKHKTELKKGLVPVAVQGTAPPGTPVMAGEKEAGVLYTQSGGRGIAWLRFDRAGGEMQAGDAVLRRVS
ncbi:MAG: folate-binding protein [Confluentimicrobium sp.]|nr:folate-binding protein [Actibacterium sp.]MBF52186.1 folate-binding protein [Actibacterium sp.]OWU68163.1 aminomethyltransferase [Roseovarius sp. 22II1-1F6A]|tara:strand:+ start:329 stop:1093 length:765 start_codon:yes stop_codon:yes gene_type:complete